MDKNNATAITATTNYGRSQAVGWYGEKAVEPLEKLYDEMKGLLIAGGKENPPADEQHTVNYWPDVPLQGMDGKPVAHPVQTLAQGVAIREDVFEIMSDYETEVNFLNKTHIWKNFGEKFHLNNMVVKVKFNGDKDYRTFYLRYKAFLYAIMLASYGSAYEKSPQGILVIKWKGKTVIWELEEFYMLSATQSHPIPLYKSKAEQIVAEEEHRIYRNFIAFNKANKLLMLSGPRIDEGLFGSYDDNGVTDFTIGKDTGNDVN